MNNEEQRINNNSPLLSSAPQVKGLPTRVTTGLLFAAFACTFAVLGGWYWVICVIAIFLVCFKELSDMMRAKNIFPSQVIVLTVGGLLLIMAANGKIQSFSVIITLGIIASFFRLLFRKPRATISDIGATLLSIFYIGYLPMHFILLRNIGAAGVSNPLEQPGLGYLFLTLFILCASDIAAYYAGKRYGKHLLYPEISPKKTREGALWGILGGLLVGLLFSLSIGFPIEHTLILAPLLVVVGQLGDLSESLLKRDAGMKDSGVLLKGHGGVLDRIDSYIFSGAISYYYIHWVVLHQGLAQDFMGFLNSF